MIDNLRYRLVRGKFPRRDEALLAFDQLMEAAADLNLYLVKRRKVLQGEIVNAQQQADRETVKERVSRETR